MKKGILILAVLLLNISLIKASSIDGDNLKKAIKKSAIIFSGKLISKELVTTEISAPKLGTTQKYIRNVYTFKVNQIFKGKIISNIITIVTNKNDVDFIEGQIYVVYSFYSNYLLTSNFYLNGEKVKPFLATKSNNTKLIAKVSKKEMKKLRRLAKRK